METVIAELIYAWRLELYLENFLWQFQNRVSQSRWLNKGQIMDNCKECIAVPDMENFKKKTGKTPIFVWILELKGPKLVVIHLNWKLYEIYF